MPDWKKKINNPGITNTTTFYGDIVNNLVDYLSVVDQGADTPLGEVSIATATTFKTGKLKLFDADSSHKVIFSVPNFSEDKTFNLPAITPTSDDLMTRTSPQIVTGKTFDFSSSNTATGIPKSAIPTQIAYEDEDNSFGQHYIDMQMVNVAPVAPPANTRRMFVNTDGKSSVRTASGAIIDLEAAGTTAQGGFANGGTATFSGNGSTTTFNITHGISPQPDIATVNAANAVTLNACPASFVITSTQIQVTFKTAPVSGTNNVSLLWAGGFVNQAIAGFSPTTVNTLTNKTLASPVFSGIATGQLTISGSVMSIKNTSGGSRLDLITENSTLNSSVDISFYHWDTNSTAVRSSAITSEMVANAPGAVATYLNFWVFKAGAFLNAFRIQHDGNFLFRRTPTTAAILSLASITAERWFTFPDVDGTLTLLEANQTITGNKTFSAQLSINKGAQAGVGETLLSCKVADSPLSQALLVNASNVDAQFVPWMQFWQRDSGSQPAYYQYGYIDATHDTGTTAVAIFDARKSDATAITTRPVFEFRSSAVPVFKINAKGDVLHIPIATAGLAESIAEFRVSDVNSYLRINNGSAIDARFLPQITARQVEDATFAALSLQARVEVAHDTGTVPVTTFDSRTQSDTALTVRPLFSFRNAGTPVFEIGQTTMAFGGKAFANVGSINTSGTLFVEKAAQAGTPELLATFRVVDTANSSTVEILNASATDAQFAPWIRSRQYDNVSHPGLYLYSYINTAHDSGTMPGLVFDARKSDDAAIATRPLFEFRTAGVSAFKINPSPTVAIHTNLILSASGLTAPRTYTLPDVSGVLGIISATQTLTNKTINATDNTITDASTAAGDVLKSNGTKFVRLARGAALQVLRVNPGGTDLEWAAPTGGGGSWDPTAVETLTNKTINVDANTVKHSTTNAAGDILRGDGTRLTRLARGTANQVLTVNSGGTDIAWAAPAAGGGNVSTGQANVYGDFDQVFRSGRLELTNPANTFSYLFTGAAIVADRIITLPLLTAGDTMVTAAFAQTLTNKTLNVDANTVKHSTTNAAGDILVNNGTQFIRLARGTANQVLAVNGGGTDIAWATGGGGGGNVSTGQANTYGDFDQVFRSGRLDVRNPADTFSYSITGSAIVADRIITLPLLTAGDTMVMEAFAQTLTNKTIAAGSNTISGIADAHIASHTSTKVTITAKGQLNSAIVYNDQVNTFGAFTQTFTGAIQTQNYLDIVKIAAPADPPAGTGRFYVKTVDANNDGVFVKLKKGGVIVEAQVL